MSDKSSKCHAFSVTAAGGRLELTGSLGASFLSAESSCRGGRVVN